MADLDFFTKPSIPLEELRDRMIKLQRDIELLRAKIKTTEEEGWRLTLFRA